MSFMFFGKQLLPQLALVLILRKRWFNQESMDVIIPLGYLDQQGLQAALTMSRS